MHDMTDLEFFFYRFYSRTKLQRHNFSWSRNFRLQKGAWTGRYTATIIHQVICKILKPVGYEHTRLDYMYHGVSLNSRKLPVLIRPSLNVTHKV